MSKKMMVCVLVTIAALGCNQAFAFPPNIYTCNGMGVSLTYTPTGLGGVFVPKPILLTLTLGKSVYKATAIDIATSKSAIGDVKTITYKILPDISIKKASFIIPTINLGSNGSGIFLESTKFKSQLALTTVATPFIVGSYVGVVNNSNYIDLACTASQLLIPL